MTLLTTGTGGRDSVIPDRGACCMTTTGIKTAGAGVGIIIGHAGVDDVADATAFVKTGLFLLGKSRSVIENSIRAGAVVVDMGQRAWNRCTKGAAVVLGARHVVTIATDLTRLKVSVVAVADRLSFVDLDVFSLARGEVKIVA